MSKYHATLCPGSVCYDLQLYYKAFPQTAPTDDAEKVSHMVPTRLSSDLPNTEKDLTESTGVVLAKDPPKVKSEESSNNVREYEL